MKNLKQTKKELYFSWGMNNFEDNCMLRSKSHLFIFDHCINSQSAISAHSRMRKWRPQYIRVGVYRYNNILMAYTTDSPRNLIVAAASGWTLAFIILLVFIIIFIIYRYGPPRTQRGGGGGRGHSIWKLYHIRVKKRGNSMFFRGLYPFPEKGGGGGFRWSGTSIGTPWFNGSGRGI